MRTFNFLSFSLSIYCLLFLLLNQLPQSSATHPNSQTVHTTHNKQRFLQKRELSDLSFSCKAQSTCTTSISSDDTVLLQLGSHAQYNLIYVINKVDEDFYINFESGTIFSARIYLNGSPSSSQIVFNTDNFLFRRIGGWTADTVISKETLAQNFGSTLVIEVTNPNAEEQIVRISFRFSKGGVTALGIALVCIGGVIILLISLCSCIRRGKSSSSTNLTSRDRQSTQGTSENSPKELTVTPYLTEENMDNYFPEAKFEDLKSTFVQSLCTICLEDMTEGNDCRQLYCEHIFHSECIKLWIKNQLPKKQACCPNCNKDMLQYNSRQENKKLCI